MTSPAKEMGAKVSFVFVEDSDGISDEVVSEAGALLPHPLSKVSVIVVISNDARIFLFKAVGLLFHFSIL